jgi:hypothetical protein
VLTIICGHYGSGKTNLAINMAIGWAREGRKVTLADMDIVNPYFTSSEYSDILRRNDVTVISPAFAATNAEVPALPASMHSLFDTEYDVIIDAGGDDAGAKVLGRFSDRIRAKDHEMIYVTNMYRPFTAKAEDSVNIMRDIEAACRLKVSSVVNNSHLKDLTEASTIIDSLEYAKEVARSAGVPLLFSTAPRDLISALPKDENFYPTDVYVGTIWEKGEQRCQK